MSDDTDALLTVWGETVTVVRNTATYGALGQPSDSWSSVATPSSDIQPVSGTVFTDAAGQKREATHRIFFPNGTAVLQKDRVRPSGWSSGDDEYEVQQVLSDEGHVEALAVLVVGRA